MRPRVRLFAIVALAACALWLGAQRATELSGSGIAGLAVALPAGYLLARALVVGWRSTRPAGVALLHVAVAAVTAVGAWRCLLIPRVQLEIALAEFESARWESALRLEHAFARMEEANPGGLAALPYGDLGDAHGILAVAEAVAADGRGERPPSRALDALETILRRPVNGPLKLHVVHRLGALNRPDMRVLGLLARAEFMAFRLELQDVGEWKFSLAATRAIRRRLCPGAFASIYSEWGGPTAGVFACRIYGSKSVLPAPDWPWGYEPGRSGSPWEAVSSAHPSNSDLRRGEFMREPHTWFEHLEDLLYLGEDARFHLRGREGSPVEYLHRLLPGERR